jgi:hypothetical protein
MKIFNFYSVMTCSNLNCIVSLPILVVKVVISPVTYSTYPHILLTSTSVDILNVSLKYDI